MTLRATPECPMSWQVQDTIRAHGLSFAVRAYRVRARNPLTAFEFRIFAGI